MDFHARQNPRKPPFFFWVFLIFLLMLSVDALIKLLGYAESASFRTNESQFEPEAVQLFRFAKEKGEEA